MPALQLNKIFCVIDPTTNQQRALTRAAEVAYRVNASIHAYLCFVLPDGHSAERRDELREAEHARHRAWLDELLEPVKAQGVEVIRDIEDSDDWRDAVVKAMVRSGPDLVVRASTRRSALRRRVMKTADWMLLRGSPCPVLFVKTERAEELTHILAAVNLRAKDEPHQRLTDLVIEYSHAVARLTGAELHAVNVYHGSVNFVHPPDLAKRVGIERNRAHVVDGSPDELIGEVAKKLGQPLVVVGSIPRTGFAGSVVGNTAERILDNVQADILSIVQQPG